MLGIHGPLEAMDLNAPGGLVDYGERYGSLFADLQKQMKPRKWTPQIIAALEAARRDELPRNLHAVRQKWRNRRLMALLAHKAGRSE